MRIYQEASVKLRAIIIPILLMTALPGATTTNATTSGYRENIANGYGLMAKYTADRSLEDLRLAELQFAQVSVDYAMPANNVENRRLLLKAWTIWFSLFDETFDPSFDPEDPKNTYSTSVTVPPGYAAGVRPDEISDARVRAQYQKDIDANNRLQTKSLYQSSMRLLLSRAQEAVKVSFGNFKVVSPADDKALVAIVQAAKLNKSRAEELDRSAIGSSMKSPNR